MAERSEQELLADIRKAIEAARKQEISATNIKKAVAQGMGVLSGREPFGADSGRGGRG